LLGAVTTEGALQRELSNPSALQTLQSYRDAKTQIVTQKWIGGALLGLSAAAIAGGVFLSPRDGAGSGAQAVLLPAPGGAAMVGVFP